MADECLRVPAIAAEENRKTIADAPREKGCDRGARVHGGEGRRDEEVRQAGLDHQRRVAKLGETLDLGLEAIAVGAERTIGVLLRLALDSDLGLEADEGVVASR